MKNDELMTVEDLQKRWKKDCKKSVYRLLKRYAKILIPFKIGRELFIKSENVEKFEQQMRIVKTVDAQIEKN